MIAESRRWGRATGLMDRRSERDALDRLVGAVQAGESRALVVRGEPGVGKTVLLDHLAGQASASGSRAANTSPTGSAASRRAVNPSACADARSSHCSSSIKQISGRSPAIPHSRLSTARPTKNRSGGGRSFR